MQFRKLLFRKVRKPVGAFISGALLLITAVLTGLVIQSQAQPPNSEMRARQILRSAPDLNINLPGSGGTPLPRGSFGPGNGNFAPQPVPHGSLTAHFEYILVEGTIYVYDIDNSFHLVKQINIPQAKAVRGMAASPATHTLYISYGGDGGSVGNGSMLAYDLLSNTVKWTMSYPFGIDSMAVTPDGTTLYMPTGESSPGSAWEVIDAATGKPLGSIDAGESPHNTVVSLDGRRVYMGPRNGDYLVVADTGTNSVIRRIGPLIGGVRPFTINGSQTLAFTTATHFLGFQVSDINTGQVLFTVPVAGFNVSADYVPSAPSHGISLSPDEREIWVMDGANGYVHVFDVSGLPNSLPKQVADLRLSRPMSGVETPCVYDCAHDGWVQHSRDGRYVFIGDSGDVFDATTRQPATNLDPLYNTRTFLEIDWQNGLPDSTTTREGLGYIVR
ncbi:MAG TPA: YncE family protein [Bryobacteraceae bacterium]|nr:YncE family protein [Bryobacteraceae bacterium]